MNTKDQFDFDGENHLSSRRDGILEVIGALPTLAPGDGTKSTLINRSEGNQLTDKHSGNITRFSSKYPVNSQKPANEGKFLYKYVKGTKIKSGMIRGHANTTSNLQTFSMEKVQQIEKPPPIAVLKKISEPYPASIPSIKSKQEQFQSIEPIKLDRLIDFPNIEDIPIIDSHPLVSNEIHKRDEVDAEDNKLRVQKSHNVSQNKKCFSFEHDFESLKTTLKKKIPDHYSRRKLVGTVERDRFLGPNKRGYGTQKGKIRRDEIKHSFRDIKQTLKASPPFCIQKCNLCALRGATPSKLLAKVFQKKVVGRLVLKRKSGEVAGTVRVKIKPPEAIKSIDTLLLNFEAAKKLESIQDHLIKPQSVQKILDIKKQLQGIKQQAKVLPIRDSMLKFRLRGSQRANLRTL